MGQEQESELLCLQIWWVDPGLILMGFIGSAILVTEAGGDVHSPFATPEGWAKNPADLTLSVEKLVLLTISTTRLHGVRILWCFGQSWLESAAVNADPELVIQDGCSVP